MRVWLKVDSGMHRAGFALEAVQAAYERLEACPSVASITLMTHFARADEPDSEATAKQITAFHEATAGLPGDRSLSNSGAVLAWPSARGTWARPAPGSSPRCSSTTAAAVPISSARAPM